MYIRLATALGAFALILNSVAPAQDKNALQIGVASSFFTDKPKASATIFTAEFGQALKKAIGRDGELQYKHTATELADQLGRKKLHFVLLHGHEYAWLLKKHPSMKPFAVVQSKHPEQAFLIVHKEGGVKSAADLRGKKIAIPMGSKEHCRVFAEKLSAGGAKASIKDFFGALEKPATSAATLDDVCRKKFDAAIIDSDALELYKDVKGPAFEKHLQILEQSEVFPAPVFVYQEGAIDPKMLKEATDGLLKLHATEAGKALLAQTQIDAFVAPPSDHAKQVETIRQSYPAPEGFPR